jgi:phosphoserine phosphatase
MVSSATPNINSSRDEYEVYSLVAQTRDILLRQGYSVAIVSAAPDNMTREFLSPQGLAA